MFSQLIVKYILGGSINDVNKLVSVRRGVLSGCVCVQSLLLPL